MPDSTLPIVINAGYDSSWNGIEIPAAFLQPPFYDAEGGRGRQLLHDGRGDRARADARLRLAGAAQYDAKGNVRDWWTQADAKRFVAEAAEAREAGATRSRSCPGLHLNGALEVGENLADVGGVALGYAALQEHLRDHPEANRTIDGFTPPQRCFLAWGQLWADKANEGALRQATARRRSSAGRVPDGRARRSTRRDSTRRSASAPATACGSTRTTGSRSGEERHEDDDNAGACRRSRCWPVRVAPGGRRPATPAQGARDVREGRVVGDDQGHPEGRRRRGLPGAGGRRADAGGEAAGHECPELLQRAASRFGQRRDVRRAA